MSARRKYDFVEIAKYVIMFCSYLYLAYVLISFDSYDMLADSFKNISLRQIIFLSAAVLLMPLNWLLESLKWQTLVSKINPLSLSEAYKSVLAGLSAGFFTPNRIGDPLGRILYIKEGHRADCAAVSAVGIAGQNFATVLCGVSAGLVFLSSLYTDNGDLRNVKIQVSIFALLSVFLYFALPFVCRRLRKVELFHKYSSVLDAVANIDFKHLLIVGVFSVLRFICYSTQYYLILLFYGVDMPISTAAAVIPLNYLLITLTPSVAFAELGIRGSYAAFLIGMVSDNTVAAALGGITVWALNYIIPMLAGNVLLAKKEK